MHHCSFSHGLSLFFSCLADGFMTHALHMAQFDQPFREQAQAPFSLPFWLLPTGQSDEVCFLLSIQDPLLWPSGLPTTTEGLVSPRFHKPSVHPPNRCHPQPKGFMHLFI